MAGLPVVIVHAIGAKTGRKRPTPLLCIRDEEAPERFAVVATNWGRGPHPAWYANLKANPRVTCEYSSRTGTYVAHEASGEEYERFWRYAIDVYRGFPKYRSRIGGKRNIPIMVMTPEG
jgi:deazaflavin-dependent oxidoreductase (nitroreductase family)